MNDITIPGIIKALVRSEERKTELQMRIADITNESLESLRALVADRDAARIGLAVEKAARVKVESELAAAHALIVKRVLAETSTTKECPQWTTVDFDYMVASIRATLSITGYKSILAAHDATKDAEIVALSAGLRLAHEQMLMAGMGSDEIERTCGLEACRRALELHDEALVKPLVEALRSTGAVLSEMFGDSEDCDSKLPAVMAQIDAALAPHKEIVR